MEPADPNFETRSRENFRSQAFMRHLGVEMTELGPGLCHLKLPSRPDWMQQHGFFHGGVVATIADVAGGYAAFSLLRPEATNVTVEFKVNLVSPADGDYLVAHASVLKHGRSLTVCRCDVLSVGDQDQKLCATSLGTYMAVMDR
ncbi:MAG: PaaI family thioesterase [Chromatiales bacterium]|nr:MAG: PaaI family thioesterase [Chromatiales bacterium]